MPAPPVPPTCARRRGRPAAGTKMDDERGVHGGGGGDDVLFRRRRRSGGGVATAVAKVALVVFLAGGVRTGVTAFSAVVCAPPRQRPHRQLISTNEHQQPAPPIMVPSPPLLGVTSAAPGTTRQFLEDIISGQGALAEQQQFSNRGSNSTVLGLTDWGGSGAFRLKEEPKAGAAAARPAARPAPRPREDGHGQGQEATGPPRVLRRGGRAAVPAKKAEPKYGYRRSANRCDREETKNVVHERRWFSSLSPVCACGSQL